MYFTSWMHIYVGFCFVIQLKALRSEIPTYILHVCVRNFVILCLYIPLRKKFNARESTGIIRLTPSIATDTCIQYIFNICLKIIREYFIGFRKRILKKYVSLKVYRIFVFKYFIYKTISTHGVLIFYSSLLNLCYVNSVFYKTKGVLPVYFNCFIVPIYIYIKKK